MSINLTRKQNLKINNIENEGEIFAKLEDMEVITNEDYLKD